MSHSAYLLATTVYTLISSFQEDLAALTKPLTNKTTLLLHLTWQWRGVSYKTTILYIGPSMSYHVKFGEGSTHAWRVMDACTNLHVEADGTWQLLISGLTTLLTVSPAGLTHRLPQVGVGLEAHV